MKIALTNGIILDGTKEMKPIKNKIILIEDTIIKDIVDEDYDCSDYEVIDLFGRYIMPGLINMHVHIPGSGKPKKKQSDPAKLVDFLLSNPITTRIAYKLCANYAKTELLSGVTTIRSVGGIADFDTKLRDEIHDKKLLGPRIIASNQAITVPGGHMAGSVAAPLHNDEEVKEFMGKLIEQKPDLIKLMITGGVLDAKEKGTPGEMKMPVGMIKTACEEAHKNGYIVAAHVESSEGVKIALENGVDSIEHGAKIDNETIDLFKEKNAFLCTTLSPALPYALFDRSVSHASEVEQYNGEMVFNGIIDCSKKALKNDIPVALGNDVGCPYITHYDFWRELVYFTKYVGVSKKFALYTATLRNAELAGIGDITGSITPGKEADLIVTPGNPLEDLTVLRNVKMVIARGTIIKNPSVKRMPECDQELDKFLS